MGQYTPKHGSWLDIAKIELSVFTQQGLDRRIPDLETLRREATAWAERRNAEQASVERMHGPSSSDSIRNIRRNDGPLRQAALYRKNRLKLGTRGC